MSTVNQSPFSRFICKLLPYRLWVQMGFLLVWLDPLALRMHTLCGPVFHCYACPLALFGCPIGIIAQFSALHLVPYFAIGLLITFGIVLGSLVCGWLCPFGLLQDLAAKVPAPRLRIPRWMGFFRYVVLVGTVIAVPFLFGESHPLFICRICPAGGLEKAVPDVVSAAVSGQTIPWPNIAKMTIIVVFIGAIFVSIRPWCRVLCPLGAIFGFFNRFSLFSLKLTEHQCTQCGRCRTLCVYGIQPDQSPNSDGCIRCLECAKCGPGALQPHLLLEQSPKNTSE